ncbi:MAG: 2,3-diketo-L-gulonate transporter substrate-binding protein YiaO [Thermoleophilia bacterium]
MMTIFEKRRILFLLLALVLALGLAACGGDETDTEETDTTEAEEPASGDEEGEEAEEAADSGETYTMKIGTVTVDPNEQNFFMQEMKRVLEEEAGDRITVELYPASQLGTIAQMMQGLQNGSLEAIALPTSFFQPLAPGIGVIDLPYFLPTGEEAAEILNGEGGAPLREYMESKGMVPVALYPTEDSTVWSKDPIETMDDFKGMKIRTFPNPVSQQTLEVWGASPTMMDSGDVYVGLQQGTIDGIFTQETFIAAMKLYESLGYNLQAPKVPTILSLMVSKAWFDELPADLQQLIRDTADEVTATTVKEYTNNYIAESKQIIEEGGVEYLEPSPELSAAMEEASQAVHEEYKQSQPEAEEIYNALKAAIEAQ